MRKELGALKEWRRRELERARARGGVQLFWFYMSLGLAWSLFMFGSTFLVDTYYGRAFDSEDLQMRALIYFVGGLLFGLCVWITQETPGAGHTNDRL